MNGKLLTYIVFITGLIISSVAAYFSILGLTTIFSGAFWPVFIMGTSLELGKLVAVSWLYNNWKITPITIKTYLSGAIAVLMLITSMGIFGLLSRAHIDQQLKLSVGASEEIRLIDYQIKIHDDTIKGYDNQIAQIDAALDKLISQGAAAQSIYLADRQRKTRTEILNLKQREIEAQAPLKLKRSKLETEQKSLEAEVGPIKYVAELIYGSAEPTIVDKAVRGVIILLILVFDPLAILLLVAFNISLQKKNDMKEIEFFDISKTMSQNTIENPTKRKRRKRRIKKAALPI